MRVAAGGSTSNMTSIEVGSQLGWLSLAAFGALVRSLDDGTSACRQNAGFQASISRPNPESVLFMPSSLCGSSDPNCIDFWLVKA